MDTRSHSSFVPSATSGLTPAGFRVVARQHDGTLALVCLAETRRVAVHIAQAAVQQVIYQRRASAPRPQRSRDAISSIFVEQWIGGATEGRWQRLGTEAGGFAHHFNGAAHNRRQPTVASGPRSGDEVACVLLPQKTRKGGWRARLLSRDLAGPITNTAAVPAAAQPGQAVTLVIEALGEDGARIQFRWPAASPELGRTVATRNHHAAHRHH